MAQEGRRVEVRMGTFACTIEGYDDPISKLKEVMGLVQQMISETPALVDVSADVDNAEVQEAMDAGGEPVRVRNDAPDDTAAPPTDHTPETEEDLPPTPERSETDDDFTLAATGAAAAAAGVAAATAVDWETVNEAPSDREAFDAAAHEPEAIAETFAERDPFADVAEDAAGEDLDLSGSDAADAMDAIAEEIEDTAATATEAVEAEVENIFAAAPDPSAAATTATRLYDDAVEATEDTIAETVDEVEAVVQEPPTDDEPDTGSRRGLYGLSRFAAGVMGRRKSTEDVPEASTPDTPAEEEPSVEESTVEEPDFAEFEPTAASSEDAPAAVEDNFNIFASEPVAEPAAEPISEPVPDEPTPVAEMPQEEDPAPRSVFRNIFSPRSRTAEPEDDTSVEPSNDLYHTEPTGADERVSVGIEGQMRYAETTNDEDDDPISLTPFPPQTEPVESEPPLRLSNDDNANIFAADPPAPPPAEPEQTPEPWAAREPEPAYTPEAPLRAEVEQSAPAGDDAGAGRFGNLIERIQGGQDRAGAPTIGAPGEGALSDIPPEAAGITAAEFAEVSGAGSVSDLLLASSAWLTLAGGKPRFSRREVMDVFDTLPGDHPKTLEARIKGYGKLVRSGTLVLINDGQFALAQPERERFEQFLS